MKMARRSAARCRPQFILCLAILCPCAAPLTAQTLAIPVNPANGPGNVTVPARIHGAIDLAGPWRFQIGDDPRWADPNFDDSAWATVSLDQPLAEQGVDTFSGYCWYRMRLKPQELSQLISLPGSPQLDLVLTSHSIGQLAAYVNGIESGHTRGMTDSPEMYQSPPLKIRLSRPSGDGTIQLAIRAWAGPDVPIVHGLLDNVELGAEDDMAERITLAADRRWDQNVIAGVMVSFLFLCVAVLGGTLFLAQRTHSEYLWLALLCLSVAGAEACMLAFSQETIPLSVFNVLILWTGPLFMIVTLEFVLRLTASRHRRIVRILQGIGLAIPLISLLHLEQVYALLSISNEVAFSAVISVLLFQAWRRGRLEAGMMLAPFLIAALANSLDIVLEYAAGRNWISARFAPHSFHLGPIVFSTGNVTNVVFLGSLISMILYRFVHVSQEEQRSTAEIEAARSVQALLIPTQLPSNRYFMLESAYLPVNGVGGDFFQVLPLKDDSLLIVVGDVSGKGLQAAMNASTLVGALRNELSHEPATVLNHLNQVMVGAVLTPGASHSSKSILSFATCLCARIYTDGEITIANAGHLSPYRDGREMELAPDLPLGVTLEVNYEQANFQLKPGERLIFLSDGVVEATNAQGELFGFERTQQVSNEPALYIAQTAQHFGQNDDITVVSLYFAARAVRRATPASVGAN